VDLEKGQRIEPQDKVDRQENSQQELPVDIESPAEVKEDEVETGKDFDPETADRDALLAKHKQLEDRLAEAEDRVLRTVAEAENFRKRLQREKEEQARYANEAIIRDLLPVMDNLERALDHSQAETDQGGLIEGLNMTRKGFLDSLARFGCIPVEAVGRIFDPNFHEAVSQEKTADHEANTVLRELQKGYMLKERLLRPAMVVVSNPPSRAEDADHDPAEAQNEKTEVGKVKVNVRKA
jgi:molecular chaperone GrpE